MRIMDYIMEIPNWSEVHKRFSFVTKEKRRVEERFWVPVRSLSERKDEVILIFRYLIGFQSLMTSLLTNERVVKWLTLLSVAT